MRRRRDGKSNKLNIAMIGHKRIPSREGGIEIVVEELATRMAKNGHKVTVYNRRGHHVCGKEFDASEIKQQEKGIYKGVRVIKVPIIEKKGMAALTSSFFASIHALFSHYDCIHYHGEGPAAMLIIPYIFGIRTVVTVHGLDWQRAKWGRFASKYLKYGEKVAVKYANEIIVLSKHVQQYFKETYNRETIFIPNGIDKQYATKPQLIREKWRLEKDSYILFLGRIVPEKGIQYLIDAYSRIDTQKRLVIAGGTSDTDGFMTEIRCKARADERIILTGFVQGQELEELFSNAYLYVLPSDLEGMPISLLEAMSYGNCCVVSNIDECVEVVEDNAVVFEKSDTNDLVDKLNWLLERPDIVQQYKNNASEFITKKYSWDNVVNMTLDLYEK